MKAQLEPFNLAPEQSLIMLLLWEEDGLTQYQLAKHLNKDKTNIARMCANLERKGFIYRVNCKDDRRSIKLFLTPLGKQSKERIIPITEKFNDIVCENLTSDEINQLEHLLTKINDNVEKYS